MVLVLLLAGLLNPPTSASATTVEGGLTVTPADVVMGNEQIRVEGWLPPARSRTVRLERRIGDGSWRLVRSLQSGTSGTFSFNDYAPAATGVDVSYRVSAPAASLGGTSYPAVQTPTRALRVVAQQSSLDAPARVLRGSTYAVRASFHPARPGRTVVLQRRSGSSWVQTATGTQAANGTVTFTRPATPLGSVTWRTVARPWRRAAEHSTNLRTVLVVASGDVTAPPVPAGLTAASGGSAVTLSWNPVAAGDLAGYRVYRGVTPDGPWVALNTTPRAETSLTDPAPVAGSVYAVTSVDALGNESARSPSVLPTEGGDLTPPPVPTGLAATPGDGTLALTWDSVDAPDLAGYRLYRSADGQAPWTPEPDLFTEPDARFGGLTNGATYFFRISSEDLSGNESDPSPSLEAVPEDNEPPPVPTDVVTDPTDREVLVSWSAEGPEDFLGFNVYVATAANGPWARANDEPVPTGEYRVTELDNGTPYWFAVTAVDTTGNESDRSASGTGTPVDDVPPRPPDGIGVAPGDRRATLTWDAVDDDGLAGYRVYRSTSSGGPWTLLDPDPVSGLEYVDTGLENGTDYWYLVTAVDLAGNESSMDGQVRVTPADDVAPPAPAGLAAAGSDGRVTLSWEPVTGEPLAGYRVYRAPAEDGPWNEVGDLQEEPSRAVTGLTNATTYWFAVTTVDAAGNESEPTDPIAGTPVDDTPPPTPQDVAATPGDRTVSLTWDPVNDDNLVGYRVYRSTGLGLSWTSLHATPITGWEYLDTGVENDVEYLYYVVAVDEWGQESGHEVPVVVTPTDDVPPPAPENLVLAPGDSEITLTWDPVTDDGLVGYEISRALDRDGPWELVTDEPITDTEHTDTGLTNGTLYWYVVRSVDEAGNRSTNNDPEIQAPVDLAPPSVPTGVEVAIDDGALVVSWDAVDDADLWGYQLYRAQSADGPWTPVGEGTYRTDVTVGGLDNGTTYWFAVSSIDTANNESARSAPASGVPADIEAPFVPTQLIGEARDRVVALEWSAVEVPDLAGYRLYGSDSEDGPWELVGEDRPANEALVEGLVNDTTYYFVATAFDEAGNESGHSPVLAITPEDDIAPHDPDGLVADAGDGRVDLSWDPVAAADLVGYRVHRATDEGGPWTLLNLTPQTGSTYADTGLDNGTEYFYLVTAVDDDQNESGSGVPVSATPQGTPDGVRPTVAAGDFHTCRLKVNGNLWCWGYNWIGQVGNGNTGEAYTLPTRVGSDSDWVSLAVGSNQNCALKANGSLWCWGTSTTYPWPTGPQRVGGDNDWREVTVGTQHACGLKMDGSVWCWGYNYDGQIGNGTTVTQAAPVRVGSGTNWVGISAGYNMTCGVQADGTAWCWGDNTYGGLGDGTTVDRTSPVRVGDDSDWSMVTVGAYFTCGTRITGSLWCWGYNGQGSLGDGSGSNQPFPARVGVDSHWESVDAGIYSTCALTVEGSAWCWGRNVRGGLGDGTVVERTTPARMGVATDSWTSIRVGADHSCGIRADGSAHCWGSNSAGQLGNRDLPPTASEPTETDGPGDWTDIALGAYHFCGVRSEGSLWCRGENSSGQLGDQTLVGRQELARVGADTDWSAVVAGQHSTCGLKEDGAAWCWGYSGFNLDSTPRAVAGVSDLVDLTVGSQHACGLTSNGEAWCWGRNFSGQLGEGPAASGSEVAVRMDPSRTWTSLAAGDLHTCGTADDGTLWCWGLNDEGQLGDGTRTNRPLVQVGVDTDWTDVVAGYGRTCALKEDRSAWCWGTNYSGQIGNGTVGGSTIPIRVSGTADWTSLSVSISHTCGTRLDGSVSCWGDNWAGQIGDGTTTSRLSPAAVVGDDDWVEVVVDSGHTCGATAGGTLRCWGSNRAGELGWPAYRTSPSPVLEE